MGLLSVFAVISEPESGYASSHVIESDYDSDYQEYFHYVYGLCGLEQPNDWKQALELYNILNDFGHYFFKKDRGGSQYLVGSGFAKSISSKLIQDLFRFNTMELWRDIPKQSC